MITSNRTITQPAVRPIAIPAKDSIPANWKNKNTYRFLQRLVGIYKDRPSVVTGEALLIGKELNMKPSQIRRTLTVFRNVGVLTEDTKNVYRLGDPAKYKDFVEFMNPAKSEAIRMQVRQVFFNLLEQQHGSVTFDDMLRNVTPAENAQDYVRKFLHLMLTKGFAEQTNSGAYELTREGVRAARKLGYGVSLHRKPKTIRSVSLHRKPKTIRSVEKQHDTTVPAEKIEYLYLVAHALLSKEGVADLNTIHELVEDAFPGTKSGKQLLRTGLRQLQLQGRLAEKTSDDLFRLPVASTGRPYKRPSVMSQILEEERKQKEVNEEPEFVEVTPVSSSSSTDPAEEVHHSLLQAIEDLGRAQILVNKLSEEASWEDFRRPTESSRKLKQKYDSIRDNIPSIIGFITEIMS